MAASPQIQSFEVTPRALASSPRPRALLAGQPLTLARLRAQPVPVRPEPTPPSVDVEALLHRLAAANRRGGLTSLAQARALLRACEVEIKMVAATSLQHAYDMRERCALITDPPLRDTADERSRWSQLRGQMAASMRALTVDEGA